jgi:hypothetical protein
VLQGIVVIVQIVIYDQVEYRRILDPLLIFAWLHRTEPLIFGNQRVGGTWTLSWGAEHVMGRRRFTPLFLFFSLGLYQKGSGNVSGEDTPVRGLSQNVAAPVPERLQIQLAGFATMRSIFWVVRRRVILL